MRALILPQPYVTVNKTRGYQNLFAKRRRLNPDWIDDSLIKYVSN